MDTEVKRILEAEETAEKLVGTLKNLHTEATSYQRATKELDAARQELVKLIASTQEVVKGSYEIISILQELGGPEILNRLNKLENIIIEELAKHSKSRINIIMLIMTTLVISIIALISSLISFQ